MSVIIIPTSVITYNPSYTQSHTYRHTQSDIHIIPQPSSHIVRHTHKPSSAIKYNPTSVITYSPSYIQYYIRHHIQSVIHTILHPSSHTVRHIHTHSHTRKRTLTIKPVHVTTDTDIFIAIHLFCRNRETCRQAARVISCTALPTLTPPSLTMLHPLHISHCSSHSTLSYTAPLTPPYLTHCSSHSTLSYTAPLSPPYLTHCNSHSTLSYTLLLFLHSILHTAPFTPPYLTLLLSLHPILHCSTDYNARRRHREQVPPIKCNSKYKLLPETNNL